MYSFDELFIEKDTVFPSLYPDFSVQDNLLHFLDQPYRELNPEISSLLSLCNGQSSLATVTEKHGQFSLVIPTLLLLENLGYIVFKRSRELARTFEPTTAPRALIVSPHMDDAFLSIGGTLMNWTNSGEVSVLNIFSHDPWISNHRFAISDKRKIEYRVSEEIFNAYLCECNVEFWKYQSAPNRGYQQWNEEINWDIDGDLYTSIRSSILSILKEGCYRTALFPLAIGGHTDHQFVSAVALDLIHSGYFQSTDLKVGFFEDLPYACYGYCWQFQSNRLVSTLRELTPEFIDITKTINQKLRMLYTYKSQLLPYEPSFIKSYAHRGYMHSGIEFVDCQLDGISTLYNERIWWVS